MLRSVWRPALEALGAAVGRLAGTDLYRRLRRGSRFRRRCAYPGCPRPRGRPLPLCAIHQRHYARDRWEDETVAAWIRRQQRQQPVVPRSERMLGVAFRPVKRSLVRIHQVRQRLGHIWQECDQTAPAPEPEETGPVTWLLDNLDEENEP